MKIVWDERKREINKADHEGLDFADVPEDFFWTARTVPAKKGRFAAFGLLDGQAVAVIFSRLGSEAISIVSLRRARVTERKAYGLL